MTVFQESVYRTLTSYPAEIAKTKIIITFVSSRRVETFIWWPREVDLKIWPRSGLKGLTCGQIFKLTFRRHQIGAYLFHRVLKREIRLKLHKCQNKCQICAYSRSKVTYFHTLHFRNFDIEKIGQPYYSTLHYLTLPYPTPIATP